MADQVTVDNGGLTDYDVSTDDAGADGQVQRVKLAVSADGSAAHIPADATTGLRVAISDGSGNQITSFGGGTQYTEDAAAAADPVGNAIIMVRKDTLAALTSTDGDNVAARGTDKGELYVKHVDSVPVTDNGGTLSIDDGAGSITVDGTVTVQDGGNVISVDDAAGSLTVDNAALSVVGGGVEAAALRVTIASDSTGVLSIDDNGGSLTVDGTVTETNSGSALTSLQLIDDIVYTDDTSTHATGTSKGALMMAAAAPTDAAVNANDIGAVAMTVNRELLVQVNTALPAGSANIGDVDVLTLPNVTLAAGTNTNEVVGDVAHNVAAAGNPLLQGGYASAAAPSDVAADGRAVNAWHLRNGAAAVNITAAGALIPGDATDGLKVQVSGAALTALQLIDDTVFADDIGFTPGTSKVSMCGFQADEASTDSVDEGDAGAARMTLDRKLITAPQGHSAGGLSIFRSIDLDEGTLEVVKNSAGCVYAVWVTNTATATRWVKFYDATSGTLGTGTPVITIGIPGNSSDDISGNFGPGGMGIGFATGICVGAGTGVADNDTGAPGANDVIINVFYK